jgi:thymidylate synthase ThyX
MIEAKVVAHSKSNFGHEIVSMQVTFPRFILAELNTHRMFSRNSASSRAIPFEKMVKSVEENPFIPIAWQKDHKGMQGTEYITNQEDINKCISTHLAARDLAVEFAKTQSRNEVTKQLCNRYLESFMWHTVLISATELENFFALRCPRYEITYTNKNGNIEAKYFRSRLDMYKSWIEEEGKSRADEWWKSTTELDWLKVNQGQAEIHMMALAEAMWDAYNESTPKELKEGEWHVPFGDNINDNQFTKFKDKLWQNKQAPTNGHNDLLIKIATARCARVSYTVVGEEGKEANYENDIKLHDRLAESGHWSPFEHCAKAMNQFEYYNSVNSSNLNADYSIIDGGVLQESSFVPDKELGWSGNFKGFVQYRKMFKNENITK